MIIDKDFKFRDLNIVLLDEVDSTNTYAKRNQFETDSLIITTYQTQGRGRHQRSFFSPKDKGIYFSLVLHNLDLSAQIYTIIMAISISENIPNSQIKWLNDVMIENKKVSGILCEGVISNQKYEKMIIGVGINLFETEVPKELKTIMTFINNPNLDIDQFLHDILSKFYELLSQSNEEIIELYKQRCLTLNKIIKIDDIQYQAIDINNEGHLICLNDKNQKVIFNNAEVTSHAHQ